ncbi:MAG: GGDEF domain-containing protein [Candidatus Hydrogenedentes bacterium]|nr:GGDEF domain-containing protein [Candidatus Hydrogenedentota bacterium]
MDDIAKLKSVIEELQDRLREEVQLRTELERRCHLLEKLAYRDPSTGLRTETYLHARVREEIDRSIRYPASATLLTLCAPQGADESVPKLGVRLTGELRATDQVFTLSTHGLAILLVETPEDGARRALDRLQADIEQFIRGYGFTVTTFPVDANQAEDFLNLALERHEKVAQQLRPEPAGAFASARVH